MERFPYRNVRFLDLEEGGFHNKADWENPSLVPAGMAMRDPLVQGRYDRNFELLVSLFEPLLSDVRAVFTHNPWGEYGHEDHVQVHQATRAIVSRRDTRLMVPAHCARKSLAMMRKTARSVDPHPFSLRVDRQAALAIKHLYEDCGCWTYHKDWMPPEQDVFLTVKYGS